LVYDVIVFKEKGMIFVNKKTVLPILLMMLGMSMVWGGGKKDVPAEDRRLSNSHGYKITDLETKEAETSPPWVQNWNEKPEWDEGEGDDKTFHVIAYSESDHNGNQKDGKILSNTMEQARMTAQDLIAYFISVDQEKIREVYRQEVQSKGIATGEKIYKDASKSMATTQLRGIKKEREFFETWDHTEGSKVTEYYKYWAEFTIPYKDIDDARKKIDSAEGQKDYFAELQEEYDEILAKVKFVEFSNLNSQFDAYSSAYAGFVAIEGKLDGLTYFKKKDKQIGSELLKDYAELGSKITGSKKEYDPKKGYDAVVKELNKKTNTIQGLRETVAERDRQFAALKIQHAEQLAQIEQNRNNDLREYAEKFARIAQNRNNDLREYAEQLAQIEQDHSRKLQEKDIVIHKLTDTYMAIAAAFNAQQENIIPVVEDIMSRVSRIRITSAMKLEARQKGQVREVQKGEYLAQIALERYGSSLYYDFIYRVNQDIIPSRNPDVIRVGIRLLLPDLPPEARLERLYNTPEGLPVALKP
jgi:hypothetical protein